MGTLVKFRRASSSCPHHLYLHKLWERLCWIRRDLLIGNYDLVNDPARPGYLYAPTSFGWCLGVQYNILPNLFVSASFSQTRYLPSHRVAGDEYKYGLMGDINIFWNLTPRIEVGAEFDWGRRKEFSGEARSARRIGVVAQFSF